MNQPIVDSPIFKTSCHHQPDRTIRVTLDQDGATLGTLQGVRGSHPIVKNWVRDHLNLGSKEFRIALQFSRPPYVVDGHKVSFEKEGHGVIGTISGWGDSAVMVSADIPFQRFSGLYPPEELTFL